MKPTFPSNLYAAVFAVAVAIAPVAAHAMGDEEFVGPFPSWANVKTYGAAGDGITDDTAAIQKGLNALGRGNPTLYFPAGTYKISQTLSLSGISGESVVGADPATTTLLWAGNSATPAASFTGTVTLSVPGCSFPSSTCYPVLTVAGGGSGTIVIGQLLTGPAGMPTTYIQAFLTGSGGAGTYKVAESEGHLITFSSQPMTTSNRSMLYIGGVSDARFDRLTFNGQNNANLIVNQTWNNVDCCFDTSNQYADDVFENAVAGFWCGNLGFGCAETSMLRDQFVNNTTIGVLMTNPNALDMWVWYSTFQNDNVGIGNVVPGGYVGAGAFQLYDNIFENSTTADITYGNTGVFNFVNNYSIGSKAFIAAGGTGGSDFALIQRNTILDTTQTQSIEQDDLGPVVLLDNVIRSASGNTFTPSSCTELGRRAGTCPVVMVGNFNVTWPTGGVDLFSMGNTFTLGTGTCSTSSPMISNGRCHSTNDQIVSRSTVNPTAPTLPGTPPNLGRTIFEASTTGSGTTCSVASPCSVQQAITNAAAGCSNNVAHLQFGAYSVGTTITVPANCPVQIVGDGNYSLLISNGANPVMKLAGPSLTTLKYFAVNGITEDQDGIEIDDVDAGGAGGRVFIEGGVLAGSDTNLFVDSIDYANVEAHNLQNLYALSPSSVGGVSVTGGAHGGQFNQYLGLVALVPGTVGYSISGTANANINGNWNETNMAASSLLNVTGAGHVTYSGSVFSVPNTIANAANVTNFTGTIGLVGLLAESLCPGGGKCGTWGNFSITGTGNGAKVLGLGLVGPSTTYWEDTSGDTSEFLNNAQYDTGGVTEIGSANPRFLITALTQLRAHQPTTRGPLTPGTTNVALYKINVNNARYGLHLVKN